jgi:hypothetical protein
MPGRLIDLILLGKCLLIVIRVLRVYTRVFLIIKVMCGLLEWLCMHYCTVSHFFMRKNSWDSMMVILSWVRVYLKICKVF